MQCPKEKGQTMIYKTLQIKLKIAQHDTHKRRDDLDPNNPVVIFTLPLVATLTRLAIVPIEGAVLFELG